MTLALAVLAAVFLATSTLFAVLLVRTASKLARVRRLLSLHDDAHEAFRAPADPADPTEAAESAVGLQAALADLAAELADLPRDGAAARLVAAVAGSEGFDGIRRSAASPDVEGLRAALAGGDFDAVPLVAPAIAAYAAREAPALLAAAGRADDALRALARSHGFVFDVIVPLSNLSRTDPRASADEHRGLHRIDPVRRRVAKTRLSLPADQVLVVACLRPGLSRDGVMIRPARALVYNHALWSG